MVFREFHIYNRAQVNLELVEGALMNLKYMYVLLSMCILYRETYRVCSCCPNNWDILTLPATDTKLYLKDLSSHPSRKYSIFTPIDAILPPYCQQ
jgi:hypothetical protein